MGNLRDPLPVKLFVGMLSPDRSLFETCAGRLIAEYGPDDLRSEIQPWERSHYYREEMGSGIERAFIFFERLIDPDRLPDIKVFTNRMEAAFSVMAGGALNRRINLDPGYVTEAKVVLASTKDFSHRVYIGRGIYAEVTLRYSAADRSFTTLDHTYPDFGTPAYRGLFKEAREKLRTALTEQRLK